ncbi:MAG: serine hydrolase [bacterium]
MSCSNYPKSTAIAVRTAIKVSIATAVLALTNPALAAEHTRTTVDSGDWSPVINSVMPSDRAMDTTELGPYIESALANYNVPGMAALLIRHGEVFWSGTFGWADIEREIPVTDTTSFTLASVSKTVTALAVMQNWERGAMGLFDGVNDYLPFSVASPYHPDDEITVHMLLCHTSGLADNWSVIDPLSTEGDCPIPLGYFLEQYFTPGGVYYHESNFRSFVPGSVWAYSNTGVALAGYLVEAVADTPFYDYCRDSIFTPLGMQHTSFRLADLDLPNVAMPYAYSGGQYIPYGHMCHAPYPAGSLFSSSQDMARHVIAFMQYGVFDTVRVLDSATVALMRTRQVGTQCIVWFSSGSGNDMTYMHSGGDWGAKTMISCRPARGIGVVVLANAYSGEAVGTVVNALYECAELYNLDIEPDTASGWAPLEVAFSGTTHDSIESWVWDFGDEDSAFVQSPTHVYDNPGVFNVVTRAITVGGDTLYSPFDCLVAVLADTLRADTVVTSAASAIEFTISITNFVPLDDITIPVEFSGSLDLDPDAVTWSTEGCRTSSLGPVARTHFSPDNKQMTFNISGAECLTPGSGPALKLYFQVGSIPPPGAVSAVSLDGYDGLHLPQFSGPLVTYAPRIGSGAIAFEDCCQGMPGNMDGDPDDEINIADLVYLVNYMFSAGPEPPCITEVDVNGDSNGPDIADLVYLVDYMFNGGPAPVPRP